jgi:3-isopropylmalate/(R)-2-methylmalate dehydratase small subunit
MGNGLLLVTLPEDQVQALMQEADDLGAPVAIEIDIEQCHIKSPKHEFTFPMSARHHQMFLEGLDVIGLTLTMKDQIDAFAQQHWSKQPWVKNIARKTVDRLQK